MVRAAVQRGDRRLAGDAVRPAEAVDALIGRHALEHVVIAAARRQPEPGAEQAHSLAGRAALERRPGRNLDLRQAGPRSPDIAAGPRPSCDEHGLGALWLAAKSKLRHPRQPVLRPLARRATVLISGST